MALREEIIYDIQVRAQEAIKEQERVNEELIRAQAQLKELNRETRKSKEVDIAAEKQKINLRKRITELKKESRDLTKEIKLSEQATNAQEGSFEQLSATSALLTKQYNKLGKETRENTEEGRAFTRQLEETNREMRELKQEVGDGRLNVGRYAESLGGLEFSIAGVQKGLVALKGALIATGIGAAVVALGQLVSEAGQLITDLNKIRAEVARATGLEGEELDRAAASLKTISTVHNVDYQQALVSSINLAERFGIAHQEAFDIIGTGLEGLTEEQAGEFLDIVKEYPEIFRQAGLSADEFISIANQQIRSGFFSDKGVDAIKEGLLSIREMPKATREALEGIGVDVDALQHRIETGQITIFEALQEVSRATVESSENTQAYGRVVADVFRGAGEDSGEYLRILGELDTSLEALIEGQNEATKAQGDLRDASERLNTALLTLTGETADDLKALQTLLINFAADALESLVSVVQAFRDLRDAVGEADRDLSIFLGTVDETAEEGNILATALEKIWYVVSNLRNPVKFATDAFNALRNAFFGVSEAAEASPIFDFEQRTVPGQDQFQGVRGPSVEVNQPGFEPAEEERELTKEEKLEAARNRLDAVKEIETEETKFVVEQAEIRADAVAANEDRITELKQRAADARKEIIEAEKAAEEDRLVSTADVAGQLANIAKEGSFAQKLFASAQASINTFLAASKALALGPPLGIPLAALYTASGLANVAKINGVTFADGGHTGTGLGFSDSTGHQVAGIVHANEYVVPEKKLANPTVRRMVDFIDNLPGFAQGGFTSAPDVPATVTSSLAAAEAQADLTRLPSQEPIFLSLTEMRRFGDRVISTENVGTL